jgi:hypothetical protein
MTTTMAPEAMLRILTLEPAGGSDQPTSAPIVVGNVNSPG